MKTQDGIKYGDKIHFSPKRRLKMHSIGIDIGTTSICGVLVDTDSGKVLKVVSKNSDSFIKTKNGYGILSVAVFSM